MKKSVLTTTALLAGLLLHGTAQAQTNTQVITRNANNTPQPTQSDFPQQTWEYPSNIAARWIAGYNTQQANRMFLETLKFKLNKGCKITAANLSLKVKATGNKLQTNDTFGIARNGQGLFSVRIWNNGDSPTQVKTLNYNLAALPNNANILNNLSTDKRLSFYVQDDTTVQSATLTIKTRCTAIVGTGQAVKPIIQPDPIPMPKDMPGEHYQCYAVKPTYSMKPETITIADQFGKTRAVLGKAVMLCNPSDKVHKDKHYRQRNPKRHLVCYQLVKHQQPRKKKVMIQNQFEGNYLTTTQRKMFCVPSHKKHLK